MKRVLLGFVWFVGIYFLICMIAGAIAGGIAGANDPANAAEAGAQAAERVVGTNRIWFMFGAAIFSIIGSAKGKLPGTKAKVKKVQAER